MTDHEKLTMRKEDRRVTDKALICAMLDIEKHCIVAMHDEPYPYVIPLNFGYVWEDKLTFYFHIGHEGHKVRLIRNNPNVSLSICLFLDRHGFEPYRNETHDYRSVSIFGKAQTLVPDQAEYLIGMNALLQHTGRAPITKITPRMRESLVVLKVTAEWFSAKAQYPISTLGEAIMPENVG